MQQQLENSFPECSPKYIAEQLLTLTPDQVVELLLTSNYPKRCDSIDTKIIEIHQIKKPEIDYTIQNNKTPSTPFIKFAIYHLGKLLKIVPSSFISETFKSCNSQFTLALMHIKKILLTKDPKEYPFQQTEFVDVPPKGRMPQDLQLEVTSSDYYIQKLVDNNGLDEPEIECKCCYMDYELSSTTHCQSGHQFCFTCARTACDILVGQTKTEFACLSSDVVCKSIFSIDQVKRFLVPTTFENWLKMVQQKEIEAVVKLLPGYTTCPFCNFGCEMLSDPNEDSVFYCQSSSCKVASCRLCKRKNHVPQTCKGLSI